ncbi:MAG: AAA family ATPase [Chloroflexota bacterium]|nr:AAA family ATPase [Chloroflexota bacterium]
MPRKIVSTGRGGTGKSTFVALMSRYLKRPSLLIDLDPDLSLADMLGIDFREEQKRTVVEALYDSVNERKKGESPLIPVNERLESLIRSDCLYEGIGFDLITLGTKDLEGCYCFPDHLLRKIIPKLAKNYMNVVIDSPAGLEHLNRNIVPDIDDLFVMLDPSEKSIKHIKKIKDITKAIGIYYNYLYLVANYMFDESSEERLVQTGETYLGKIEYDAEVEDYNLRGKSLRELPEDSPACLSVKMILAKARLI